jgi:lysozyme
MADIELAKRELDRHLRFEEGERLKPYRCDAGVPTIGVGATTYLDGRKVKLSDPPITREQMNRMLSVEIDRYMAEVMEMVDGIATTFQLVGLVLCAYNIGLPGLRGSTMIRLHRKGDYAGAARAFRLWNKYRPKPGAPLQVHPVLEARRQREAGIYMTPEPEDVQQRMPQAVEAESSLAKSPINASGAAAVGLGGLTAVTQVADQVQEASGVLATLKASVHQLADFIGLPPGALLALALIGVGFVVMQQRRRQRDEGWA